MRELSRTALATMVLATLASAQDEQVPLPGAPQRGEAIERAYSRRAPDESSVEARLDEATEWMEAVADALRRIASGAPSAEVDVGGFRVRRRLRPPELDGARVAGAMIGWTAADPHYDSGDVPNVPLAGQLAELVSAFESDYECKFKVVGVQPRDDGTLDSFDARYDGHGRTSEGRVQQTATWRVRLPFGNFQGSVTPLSYEEVGAGEIGFEDVTRSAFASAPSFEEQLAYSLDHWSARIDAILGMSLLGHEGLALGDVNGDGLDDLYVLQPGGLPNRLYLHEIDDTLVDVSASAGVDYLDGSRSALFLDLDGDGDQDLVAVVADDVLIHENTGGWETEEGGKFALKGVLPAPSFFSISAADYDSDGDLDLYGCAYSLPYWEDSIPLPYHDANNGRANVLYRNDGEWRWSDVTQSVGLSQNNQRYSFAAAWEDYDNDGDLDLYVANDFGRNNLYRNDDGKFTDVAAAAGVEDISAGMGVAWSDVDGDGWMDLYVSNMYSSAGKRVAYQRNFQPEADEATRGAFRRHARGNSLFRNKGDGTFEDVSESAGVTMGRWAWGSVFCDVNNDGREDIVVPNGFVTGEDKDDL